MPGEDAPSTMRARLAAARSRRLVDELAKARQRRRITPGGVAIYVLATVVHAFTAAFLALGLWLLVDGDGWPLRVAGALCLLVPAAVLPRVAGRPEGEELGDDAPQALALVAEVAAVVDSPLPRHVVVNDELNAYATSSLLHGRTIGIGAPLWVACSPQARVALLAHELGHHANRDLLHGRYVAAAVDAVIAWHDIFSPRSLHDEVLRENGIEAPSGTFVAYILFWPVRALLIGYLRLMELTNASARRRQEHYADLAAVRAAGTDGAVDLLETTLAHDGVVVTANRVAVTPGRPPLRPALEAFAADYDAHRRSQARTRGAAEGTRLDHSHPPTVERLRLVESVEHTHAAVVLDAGRSAAIEHELAGPVDRGLASFADQFRGW